MLIILQLWLVMCGRFYSVSVVARWREHVKAYTRVGSAVERIDPE